MTRDHRLFHRRAAQAVPPVVTVKIDVVATVDTNGSLLAQVTKPLTSILSSALPAAVTAPSIATVPILPSVPAVPPFPSNLNVPSVVAYPWPTGVAAAQAVGSTTPIASVSATTVVPSIVSLATVISPTTSVVPASSFHLLDSLTAASELHTSHGLSTSATLLASGSATSAESTATASDAVSPTVYGVGGWPTGASAPAAATGTATSGHGASAPTSLQTPQVVGSVVGSLAGAAFILAIVLLIRRHKRNQGGALQLIGDDHNVDDAQSIGHAPVGSSAIPAAFLRRFSIMSKSTVETTLSGGERSFQKVSGRKLPSAFSGGMTSDQFSRGEITSGSSFYQDDKGTYGGPGLPRDFDKEIDDTTMARESGQMNIRPGPARTPVIRHPDENPFADLTYLSPPQSPGMGSPGKGSLGRSLHSADGSRSSRFTENV